MSALLAKPGLGTARALLFGILLLVLVALGVMVGGHELNPGRLQHVAAELNIRHPLAAFLAYFTFYVVATALSFPGAALLTLGAGALFGVVEGALLVSFAASIGASCAFLTARFLLRDFALSRFPALFARIDQGIARDGAFYLVSLRLVPVIPFFAVNLLAGLTKLSLRRFYLASQLGMFPATLIYVNAGVSLAALGRHGAILTPRLVTGLLLLAALPVVTPRIRDVLTARRQYAKWKRPKKFDRNLVVIGAGAAGLVSAYVANALRAKVTLIEQAQMGGDCLNTGCVPSKALLHAAKHGLNFAQARAGVKAAVEAIAPHNSVARYASLGVDVRHGRAMIESPWCVAVDSSRLTTRAIIIAAGAEPFVPPIPGLAGCPYATSETLWDIEALPARLTILGGGPIGCEMAQAFARLGSIVTLVEMTERLLPREDDDVSTAMTAALRRDGVTVLTGHRATEILHGADGFSLRAAQGEQNMDIAFDRLLVAIGRKPRLIGYGLEALGIPLTAAGTIETDAWLQTLYPNIFACGDVAGPYQYTHAAGFQAGFAALNALLGPFWRFKPSYRAVPAVTYTSPGDRPRGVERARGANPRLRCRVPLHRTRPRHRRSRHRRVCQSPDPRKGSDKILGATIVGTRAGEI